MFTAAQMAAKFLKELRVTVDGKPVTFPISLYQVKGCTMAPLRQMAQALGYTFDYDGSSGTAVCTRGTDTISVRAGNTQATVNGRPPAGCSARRAAQGYFLRTRPILCRGGGGGCDLGCGGADLLPHHRNSGGINMRRRVISVLAAALAAALGTGRSGQCVGIRQR